MVLYTYKIVIDDDEKELISTLLKDHIEKLNQEKPPVNTVAGKLKARLDSLIFHIY